MAREKKIESTEDKKNNISHFYLFILLPIISENSDYSGFNWEDTTHLEGIVEKKNDKHIRN